MKKDELDLQVEARSCDEDAIQKDGESRAPEGIRGLMPEERERMEKALVRKIDFRLLPMIILM